MLIDIMLISHPLFDIDLPYDSLISCASTSKAMLYDALPLVTTLNIEKSSQLRLGVVSKHLRDVHSVSVYNLFQKDVNTNRIQIDEDIATQSVPFLIASTFPQLESVAFWGKCGNNLLSLNTSIINDDQGRCIYSMLDAFSGAFYCRTLPQNLHIVGLSCPNTTFEIDGSCQTCKRVCNKCPLEVTGDIDLCLPFARSNEIVESRKGGQDYLRSETRFMQLLGKSHVSFSSSRNDFCIIGHDYEVRSELRSMIESSDVNVKKLNLDVVQAIKKRHPNNSVYYLREDSFDLLKSIGILINEDLLDPLCVRVENLDRMASSIMEETDSFFSPVNGLNQINCLLRKQDPPIERVVKSGILPKVVLLLQTNGDYNVQLAASDILLNVASGASEHVEEIVKLRAIPPLVHLLSSTHTELPFNAAWALGNIAGDAPPFRDLVLQAGVVQPLLKLLEDHQTSDIESVRTYVWLLSNLCRGTPRPDFNLVSPILQTLNELINHSDEEVVKDACWALSYLINGSDEHIQTVIDGLDDRGICHLVELLDHSNMMVQLPALRTLGHIVKERYSRTQFIIDNKILPCLRNLLSSTNAHILHDACLAISNITKAGIVEQIQAVIDSGIITELISMLSDGHLQQQIDSEGGRQSTKKFVEALDEDEVRSIRKQAGFVLANTFGNGSRTQCKNLVNQGYIPLLIDLLKEHDILESTERVEETYSC